MKVKVIKSFIDRLTNNLREEGDVFECSPERYKEIMKAGHYVEIVAEPSKPIDEEKKEGKKHGNKRNNNK